MSNKPTSIRPAKFELDLNFQPLNLNEGALKLTITDNGLADHAGTRSWSASLGQVLLACGLKSPEEALRETIKGLEAIVVQLRAASDRPWDGR